jgi:hypothetical protein
MDAKECNARDLAARLCDPLMTDVEPDEIENWPDYDVYEWLEVGWGFEWDEDAEEWTPIANDDYHADPA